MKHIAEQARQTLICFVFMVAYLLGDQSFLNADTWRGTAPFCSGQCLPGEVQIATSKSGNGGTCWTGYKVKCKNGQQLCTGTQTKVSCAAFVQICDNGYYELPSNAWQSCGKYACGICIGLSSARNGPNKTLSADARKPKNCGLSEFHVSKTRASEEDISLTNLVIGITSAVSILLLCL